MNANRLDLDAAREHEAALLRIAAPAKVLPPRPARRPRRYVVHLRVWRRRRTQPALEAPS
jgi:hypothetical protein